MTSSPEPSPPSLARPTGARARAQARRTAVQALYQWQMTGQGADEVERQFRADLNPSKVDLEYFHVLLDGVVRQREELDAMLSPLLDRPIEQVDPVERAVLRLGTFELRHRLETPLRVVLNEAVSLAKLYGAEQGHRYVNGVLDRLGRALRAAESRRPGT